jgi:hypothetical protein
LSATIDREKIIDIFENYNPGHCGGLMILTENNKPLSFRDHWTSNYKAYLEGKSVHCCNVSSNRPGRYFYVYVNLNIESQGLGYGYALITYKEHVNAGGQADRITVRTKSNSRFAC